MAILETPMINFNEPLVRLNPTIPASLKIEVEKLIAQHPDLEPLVWIMSSGTSSVHQSSFKLIGLTHQALQSSAQSVNTHLYTHVKDSWLNVLPLFHVGGLSILYRSYLSSIPCFNFWSEDYKWNPQHFVNQCKTTKATLTSLVPTQVYDLVSENLLAPPSLRAIVVGGARLNQDLFNKARSLGWPLLPSYGMTELGSQIATATIESLARPQQSSLADDSPDLILLSHHEAKVNNEQRLLLKSTSLMSGFYPIADGIPQPWVQPKDSEGWYATQDCVQLIKMNSASGPTSQLTSLKVLGRIDEVIKIRGENVNLADLRNRLESLKSKEFSTYDFTIVPLSHARLGVELLLIGNAPLEVLNSMALKFNTRALPFERIKAYQKTITIPRNALGKIQIQQLIHSLEKDS